MYHQNTRTTLENHPSLGNGEDGFWENSSQEWMDFNKIPILYAPHKPAFTFDESLKVTSNFDFQPEYSSNLYAAGTSSQHIESDP